MKTSSLVLTLASSSPHAPDRPTAFGEPVVNHNAQPVFIATDLLRGQTLLTEKLNVAANAFHCALLAPHGGDLHAVANGAGEALRYLVAPHSRAVAQRKLEGH